MGWTAPRDQPWSVLSSSATITGSLGALSSWVKGGGPQPQGISPLASLPGPHPPPHLPSSLLPGWAQSWRKHAWPRALPLTSCANVSKWVTLSETHFCPRSRK